MSATTFIAASLGCGAGAVLRYWLSTLRRHHVTPWPTILANVLGTALLGAASSLMDAGSLSEAGAFIVGGGVAGGLTTFSTLAVDTVVLWRASRTRATVYVAVTAATGVASGLIGWYAAAAFA